MRPEGNVTKAAWIANQVRIENSLGISQEARWLFDHEDKRYSRGREEAGTMGLQSEIIESGSRSAAWWSQHQYQLPWVKYGQLWVLVSQIGCFGTILPAFYLWSLDSPSIPHVIHTQIHLHLFSRGWEACPWRTASSDSPQVIKHHPSPSTSPSTRESDSLELHPLPHHHLLCRLRASILLHI